MISTLQLTNHTHRPKITYPRISHHQQILNTTTPVPKTATCKREVLTPLGWTERLDISTEQWKSTLEKLQQNGQK